MSAAAAPAPDESIDDRIARLRRELADAEIEKVGERLSDALAGFSLLARGWAGPAARATADDILLATGVVRTAWASFVATRGGAPAPAPLVTLAAPEMPVPTAAPLQLVGRIKPRCGKCDGTGHNARTCGRQLSELPAPPLPTPAITSSPPSPPLSVPPSPRNPQVDALVAQGMPWARTISAYHARRSSTRAGMAEDLHSAALEGLLDAARRFDSSLGVPFRGFAAPRIGGAVRDYLRDQDHLSRDHRRAVKADPDRDIPAPVSFESIPGLDEILSGPGGHGPLEETERRHQISRLEAAARSLRPSFQAVLKMRYTENLSLVQIGEKLGVTESRACQIHGEAIAALRAALAPLPPPVAIAPPLVAPRPQPAPSNPNYLYPGRGWGPVDADGVSVHALCDGTGRIRVRGITRGCFPCSGTGKRQCVPGRTA